jgi:hypothetical protein
MLKTALSALALAALMTGVATGGADAKAKAKKAKVADAASCTASPIMPDHMRFYHCFPAYTAKK